MREDGGLWEHGVHNQSINVKSIFFALIKCFARRLSFDVDPVIDTKHVIASSSHALGNRYKTDYV